MPPNDRTAPGVQQMLVGPEALNDRLAESTVDLGAAHEVGEPVLRLLRLGSLVCE